MWNAYNAMKQCTVNPTDEWPVVLPNICMPCNQAMRDISHSVAEEQQKAKLLFGVELEGNVQCSVPCLDQSFWVSQYYNGTNR